jgi:hypothetical protein
MTDFSTYLSCVCWLPKKALNCLSVLGAKAFPTPFGNNVEEPTAPDNVNGYGTSSSSSDSGLEVVILADSNTLINKDENPPFPQKKHLSGCLTRTRQCGSLVGNSFADLAYSTKLIISLHTMFRGTIPTIVWLLSQLLRSPDFNFSLKAYIIFDLCSLALIPLLTIIRGIVGCMTNHLDPRYTSDKLEGIEVARSPQAWVEIVLFGISAITNTTVELPVGWNILVNTLALALGIFLGAFKYYLPSQGLTLKATGHRLPESLYVQKPRNIKDISALGTHVITASGFIHATATFGFINFLLPNSLFDPNTGLFKQYKTGVAIFLGMLGTTAFLSLIDAASRLYDLSFKRKIDAQFSTKKTALFWLSLMSHGCASATLMIYQSIPVVLLLAACLAPTHNVDLYTDPKLIIAIIAFCSATTPYTSWLAIQLHSRIIEGRVEQAQAGRSITRIVNDEELKEKTDELYGTPDITNQNTGRSLSVFNPNIIG